MLNVLTIPKKLLQKGELVIVPRIDYEYALGLNNKRILWEEKDTDEAIQVFEKERAARKLQKTSSFSAILSRTRSRTKTKQ